MNPYPYVLNNPLKYVDPLGLSPMLSEADLDDGIRAHLENIRIRAGLEPEISINEIMKYNALGRFVNNSSQIGCVEETGRMKVSDKGILFIGQEELSDDLISRWNLGEYDSNGTLLGVYPYYVFKKEKGRWVSDGGITLGYGHWVSEEIYNTNAYDRELIDTYAPGASFVPPTIPSNGRSYIVPGSNYLTLEKMREIKSKDVMKFEDTLNEFIEANNIILQQHQFDMLISISFQYGQNMWTEYEHLPGYLIKGNGNYDRNIMEEIYKSYGSGEKGNYKDRRKRELDIFFGDCTD